MISMTLNCFILSINCDFITQDRIYYYYYFDFIYPNQMLENHRAFAEVTIASIFSSSLQAAL